MIYAKPDNETKRVPQIMAIDAQERPVEERPVIRLDRIKGVVVKAGYTLALVYAVYVRTFFIPGALGNPHTNVLDSDAARFFRLIDLISRKYPSLPMFDSFANFPWGMKQQLPPIWAFIEASFALAVNRATNMSIPSAAALFPLILGLFFVFPAYYAGNRLFGRRAGHAAVFVSLYLPVASAVSSLGMVDHHLADILLYMSTIALLVGSHHYYSSGESRRAGALAVLAGLTVTFTLLISLSAILVIAILGVAFMIGLLVLAEDERRHVSRIGGLTMASSGLSMLMLYLATPWFENRLSFSGLSLFQPVLLIGLAGILVLSRAIDASLVNRQIIRVAALFGLYLVIAAIPLFLPGLGEQIVRGFYRSIAYYPLGRVTQQLKPLFADGPQNVFVSLSALVYLLPLGLIVGAREAIVSRRLGFGRLLFFIWFIIAGFYALMVRYYVFLFTPVIVLSFALLIAKLSESVGKIVGAIGGERLERPATTTAWLVATIAFSSYLIFWMSASGYMVDVNRVKMLEWIRENTPKVSNYYEPNRSPEYGIVAEWSYGELVELIAERPTLTTGNHETGIDGIIASNRIFQSRTEAEAVKLMKELRLRYIILQDELSPWTGKVEEIGESGPDPYKRAHLATKQDITRRDYMQLTNVRMHRFWGAGNEKEGAEPLQRFRLINVTGGDSEYATMLFELVEGARLSVKVAPGTVAAISTKIRPKGAKAVDWKLTRKAGADGRFEIFLPYATKSGRYPVKADTFKVSIAGKTYPVDIAESDVSQGKSIVLEAPLLN